MMLSLLPAEDMRWQISSETSITASRSSTRRCSSIQTSRPWFLGGFVQIMRGEPDNAIERLAYAMRSSPLDSEMYRMQCGTALAHLFAGRFDEAAPWAEKALRDLPSFLIALCIVAASHAFAGRMEKAKRAMQKLRRLDPALRLSNLRDWLLFHRPEYLTTLSDGLRRAGLPE
jgi:tetratricopeptide (TPR) repeat protein